MIKQLILENYKLDFKRNKKCRPLILGSILDKLSVKAKMGSAKLRVGSLYKKLQMENLLMDKGSVLSIDKI